MNQCIANSFASGEALEDALFISPSMLFQVDEIDTLINSMKSGAPRAEAMIGKMLEIFTSSSSSYTIRSKAMGRAELIKRKKEQKEKGFDSMAVDIQNPYLVIFGTAIPEMFFSRSTSTCSPTVLSHDASSSRPESVAKRTTRSLSVSRIPSSDRSKPS